MEGDGLNYNSMLLPAENDCKAMFYHAVPEDAATPQNNGLLLAAGASISFDTYYNLFPLQTYREFTVCSNPLLSLKLKGCGTVSLIACDADGLMVAQEVQSFSSEEEVHIRLSIPVMPETTTVLYWRCEAMTDCRLTEAQFTFSEQEQRQIILAVGICTYLREEFVIRNADRISALFAQHPQHAHHVFISDNGRTLSGRLENTEYVTVYPNPNTGGSGGFARVMMESLQSETPFTHLLLMDDDIDFRPEILQRILCFLSYCRQEHQHITVGGAMCLLDRPWQQFEAGARFLKGGILQGLQMGLDLRNADACIQNAAAPQEADYQSWWCCCMSLESIRKAGLPLPFFFKMDDVEYAIRLGQQTVCLPGVCVAHEDFDKKYSPALEYYITRNTLISCALHKKERNMFRRISQLYAAVLRNILLQRYDSAALVLQAYRDFLKGAKFLDRAEPALLHQKITASVPKLETSDHKAISTEKILVSRWMRLLSLNGLLLPSIRENAVVDIQHAVTADAYRARSLVHINPHTGMQYRTVLSRKRSWCLFWRTFPTAMNLLFRYHFVKHTYKRRFVYLRGKQFWGKCNSPEQTSK